jgi:hypothetical protein
MSTFDFMKPFSMLRKLAAPAMAQLSLVRRIRCSSFTVSWRLCWLRSRSPSIATPAGALGLARGRLSEEIIGRSVQLTDFDGLGASPTPSPTAIIADHEASNYRAEFSRLFMVDGREEGFAWLRARHTGYPVSGAQRRATFVNGSLESGRRFIARIRVL